ncbi:MAG: hypothetical protein R6V53_05920 [Candidatus Woesearchaeota archaeon]
MGNCKPCQKQTLPENKFNEIKHEEFCIKGFVISTSYPSITQIRELAFSSWLKKSR